MIHIRKRRRGTAIVDTPKGILLVSGRKRIFITPGGGANKHESRTHAAVRELREETGLKAYYTKYLFRHKGKVRRDYKGGYFQDYHTVVLVKARGTPRPKEEVKYVEYYHPRSSIRISQTTKEILDKYYKWKQSRALIKKIKSFLRL